MIGVAEVCERDGGPGMGQKQCRYEIVATLYNSHKPSNNFPIFCQTSLQIIILALADHREKSLSKKWNMLIKTIV